ncbi:MAG: hypothetical protein IPL97_06920 [Niastella sp.]|nr:hypothetical protein [Niastella sp.]
MNRIQNIPRPYLLLTVFIFLLGSCKKDDKPNNNNNDVFPTPISNFVSQGMVDSLRAVGANVYSGTTPPIVNGIYFMHPDSCTFDNSPGNFTGTIFSDYKFKFSNQDNSLYTLLVEQKAIPSGTLSSTPVSIHISGAGNQFSIFLLRTVTPTGITVEQYNILSGTLTSNGIQGLQNILYVRSKGSDPGNIYPPAGTIRLFVNGAPGLAANTSTF